jgi:hypothetical protein
MNGTSVAKTVADERLTAVLLLTGSLAGVAVLDANPHAGDEDISGE